MTKTKPTQREALSFLLTAAYEAHGFISASRPGTRVAEHLVKAFEMVRESGAETDLVIWDDQLIEAMDRAFFERAVIQ